MLSDTDGQLSVQPSCHRLYLSGGFLQGLNCAWTESIHLDHVLSLD